MKLNALQSTKGSRSTRNRRGMGIGSGNGKTGGRGHKGQKSRSGGKVARGFEGGQMPLIRRVPKRGFTSMAKGYQIINLIDLARFDADSKVDAASLYAIGLVRNATDPIKLLGNGELTSKLEIHVTAASTSAQKAVEASDGSLSLSGAK
ncbi:MAG: 50S ribosomal protein L15 [Mariprofundaceae bacterium]|nr:50S ribosomal protein L15 [Mariprofundaceae bacterium]